MTRSARWKGSQRIYKRDPVVAVSSRPQQRYLVAAADAASLGERVRVPAHPVVSPANLGFIWGPCHARDACQACDAIHARGGHWRRGKPRGHGHASRHGHAG